MSVNEFETDYYYSAVFIVLFYNLIGIIIVELCRKYQGFQIIFCSVIFPVVPTYIYYETMTLWSWTKLALILLMCIISIIIRFYPKMNLLQWTLSIIFMFSIIGPLIIELTDSIQGDTFYLNVVSAAIILICTNVPFTSTNTIFISNVHNQETFHYQMSLLYIIAVTTWDYVFLLNDQCYEKLLIASIYLLIPIWFLIMGKLSFCKQFCIKSNIYKSEWFILRLYSSLLLMYIDALPSKEVLDVIPFWNLYTCSEMVVPSTITWTFNIASFLCASLLFFFQIYPFINPNDDIANDIELEKNKYDTKHATLVDDITVDDNDNNNNTLTADQNENDNTLSTTTTTTQSTQNQQQKQEQVEENNKNNADSDNNNEKESEQTLSFIQWIIKRCTIIQYDDKNYFRQEIV